MQHLRLRRHHSDHTRWPRPICVNEEQNILHLNKQHLAGASLSAHIDHGTLLSRVGNFHAIVCVSDERAMSCFVTSAEFQRDCRGVRALATII